MNMPRDSTAVGLNRLDRFLSPTIRANRDDLRRARILAGACLAAAPTAATLAVIRWVLNGPNAQVVAAAAIVISLITAFLQLGRMERTIVPAWTMLGTTTAGLAFLVIADGGGRSPGLLWFPFLPLLGGFFLGRSANYLLGSALMLVSASAAVAHGGADWQVDADFPVGQLILRTVASVFSIGLAMFVTRLYEDARLESERGLRRLIAVMEASPDLVATVDGARNTTFINSAGAQLVEPGGAAILIDEPSAERARETGFDAREAQLTTIAGPTIDVLKTVVAHRDERGDLSYYSVVAHDITRLKDLDRLKSEFVSTVSHELRTPLTSIRGAIGLVVGGVTGPVEGKALELLTVAQSNTDRLVRLINDILDLEKIEAGKLELTVRRVRVDELMEATVSNTEALARTYGVAIATDEVDRALNLTGDKDRLVQVMTNLVGNALKFSPRGKSIALKAVLHTPETVRISVEDVGPGIPPDKIGRLFERFEQVDGSDRRKAGGTGLGLAISKALIDQHGGFIGVESTVGRGSRFYFDLPMRRSTSEIDALRPAQRQRQVLLVEDDRDLSQVLSSLLETRGYGLRRATTLKDAKQAITELPDVVLLDLGLPDGAGIDLVARMRQSQDTAGIPVIILTGNDDPIPEGPPIRRVLRKPFDNDSLYTALVDALRVGAPRVLIVEDDAATLQVLTTQLEATGFTCDEARDGATALACARHQRPDLIIMDVSLPNLDGFELVEILRSETPTTPLIVFTAQDLTERDRLRLTLGPTRHFTKGDTAPDRLANAAQELVGLALTGDANRLPAPSAPRPIG